MKKLLSIIAAAALLISMLSVMLVPSVSASAEDEVVITISNYETAAGEIIRAGDTFEINISTNAIDAVGAFELVLRYNKTFMKAAEPTLSGFLAEMDVCDVTTSNAGVFTEISIASVYFSDDALTTEGGVIMTLEFKALKDITADSAIFALADKCKAFANWTDMDSLPVTIVDGGVVITPAPEEEPEESAKISLLPAAADKFTCVDGGGYSVSVSSYGSGYKFTSDGGWPSAYYAAEEPDYVIMDVNSDELVLYYDFTVVSGEANVYVFFAGINPGGDIPDGTYVSLGKFLDQSKLSSAGDIAVGTYKGFVKAKDLGCGAGYITSGKFTVSGMKLFAVGGEVIVNELSVGKKIEDGETTTTTAYWPTTTRNPSYNGQAVTYSLMPNTASEFNLQSGGDGNITVRKNGSGYTFYTDRGWPAAYTFENVGDLRNSKYWVMTKSGSGSTLNYDFEVVSGTAKVVVYFCGQNPNDMVSKGSFVDINGLEHPEWVDSYYGETMQDLPVGKYSASVDIDALGYAEWLKGDNGEMLISGMKIFAVGGEVIINELSITEKSGYDNSHHRNVLTDSLFTPSTTTANPLYTTTTRPLAQHSSVTNMPVVPSAIEVGGGAQQEPSTTPTDRVVQTLLPASASDFETQKMGPNWNEPIYVNSNNYGGYTFSAPEGGWPCAYYAPDDQSRWAKANVKDADCYLTWDFSCTGYACIVIYFEGASPNEMATYGTVESINYYIDPNNGKYCDNAVRDLYPGDYKGAIRACDLGVREDLIREDGTVRISGIKVFAVGGEVIVRELAVGKVAYTTAADASSTTTTRPSLDGDYIYYTVNSDGVTATIVDASIQTPGIRIPSVVGGKKVTAIADGAFDYENRLYSIEIPSSVTSIGAEAFYGCQNLVRVVLNQGAWQIGNNAFAECPKLGKVYYSGSPYQWEYLSIGSGNERLRSARVFFDYAPYKAYPDVPKSAWYYQAVDHVSNYGFITGYASGSFGAVDNLQRQDFVVILARIAGADLSAYQGQNGGMRDVKAGSYYAAAVAWAVDNGIITGYQNGKFGVGDVITREQVCTIFYRYMGSPTTGNVNGTLNAYPDYRHVSSFSKTAVAWAIQNGVISGTNGKIAPTAGASRAQIATIVMRMDNNGMLY